MASTLSVNATRSMLLGGWQEKLCVDDAGISKLFAINTVYLQGRLEDDGHNHGYYTCKGAGRVMDKVNQGRLLGFSGSRHGARCRSYDHSRRGLNCVWQGRDAFAAQ